MTTRPSSFLAPHKALRRSFAELLALAGNIDPDDAPAVRDLVQRLRELFLLLELHADDENAVLLSALQPVAPDIDMHDRADHERLEALQHGLTPMLDALSERPNATDLDTLYTGLQELFARHLLHMREEEQVTQPALWRHFTDAELDAMRSEILRRLGPERSLLWSKHIFPALRPQEARPMLAGLLSAPDATFVERAREVVRGALGEERWLLVQGADATVQ